MDQIQKFMISQLIEVLYINKGEITTPLLSTFPSDSRKAFLTD